MPALGVEARWASLAGPIEATVLESDAGRVVWRCLQPRARAEIGHRGETIRGLGYLEHLAVEIPPWHLPIDALLWGRFLGERHTLVWIDWRGPHARRLAWLDGRPLVRPVVDEQERHVGGEGASLAIDYGRVLRRGAGRAR